MEADALKYLVEYPSEVRFELPVTWSKYTRNRQEFERRRAEAHTDNMPSSTDSLCIFCQESCVANSIHSDRYWALQCIAMPRDDLMPRIAPCLSACARCVWVDDTAPLGGFLDDDRRPAYFDFAPTRTGARKSFKFDTLHAEND